MSKSTKSAKELSMSYEEVPHKYVKKLENDVVILNQTVDRLLAKIQEQEEEILNLKKMTFKETPIIGSPLLSDEELIAELQLKRLTEKAKNQELNLEEIKRFDLLVKNKRLVQGKSTDNTSSLPRDVTPTKLLDMASSKKSTEK